MAFGISSLRFASLTVHFALRNAAKASSKFSFIWHRWLLLDSVDHFTLLPGQRLSVTVREGKGDAEPETSAQASGRLPLEVAAVQALLNGAAQSG
jgi:hypothetical protein